VEFLIMPPEETESEIDKVIKQMEAICERVEELYDSSSSPNSEAIQQEENKLYEVVSRVKMIYISKRTAAHMLSKILEVSRKYNNNHLLKYVFLKVVPLLYCMTDNILSSLTIAAETLYYVVLELNSMSNLGQENSEMGLSIHEQDTFDDSIKEYERAEETQTHY
jgi:hypothetical protein